MSGTDAAKPKAGESGRTAGEMKSGEGLDACGMKRNEQQDETGVKAGRMHAEGRRGTALGGAGEYVRGTRLADLMTRTLSYDELTNCMRCGFCQPACPTFKETGLEAASPRGRIALMKAVVDGLMVPDQAFEQQMDLCLGCRACEPVCPADVKYGHLIEQTRDAVKQTAEHGPWVKLLRNVTFKQLFPRQDRMRLLGRALRLYQRSGLQNAVRKSGMMRLFPETLRQMERILPDASSHGVVEQLGTLYPAKGKPAARLGMFRGCLMDVLFTDTNVNTVKLLSEAGFEVVIPDTQNCCGALHAHGGELQQARELARRNIDAFRGTEVDYIISNAGGCGAMLAEYGHLLHDDPAYAEDALRFAARVKDVSQMIMEKGRIPRFAAGMEEPPMRGRAEAGHGLGGELAQTETSTATLTVTYQDSCHLRNVMRAGQAPRDLMKRVEGVQVVELRGADRCCGSAGIYNLVQPEMSMDILDHKMEHVIETDAHYLLTSNPGCLLQMKLGIERAGLAGRMKAVHIVDFLYENRVK